MPEGVITLIIILAILAYLYVSKVKRYEVMLRIAELGENVDERVITALEKGQRSHKDDYRSALIWIAVGIPIAIAIWGTSVDSERYLGFIPILISFAYLVSGKLRLRDVEQ